MTKSKWPFLRRMMAKMGFSEQWVGLVMKCVTTVTYRIKVNGDYTEWIIPQ
jgi:hypothetical protein